VSPSGLAREKLLSMDDETRLDQVAKRCTSSKHDVTRNYALVKALT
jgi:hypothetical protein